MLCSHYCWKAVQCSLGLSNQLTLLSSNANAASPSFDSCRLHFFPTTKLNLQTSSLYRDAAAENMSIGLQLNSYCWKNNYRLVFLCPPFSSSWPTGKLRPLFMHMRTRRGWGFFFFFPVPTLNPLDRCLHISSNIGNTITNIQNIKKHNSTFTFACCWVNVAAIFAFTVLEGLEWFKVAANYLKIHSI